MLQFIHFDGAKRLIFPATAAQTTILTKIAQGAKLYEYWGRKLEEKGRTYELVWPDGKTEAVNYQAVNAIPQGVCGVIWITHIGVELYAWELRHTPLGSDK